MLLGPTGPYGLADPLTSTVGVAAMVAIISTVAYQRWIVVFRRIGMRWLFSMPARWFHAPVRS
ncbi:hypothetical protein [Microbacterium sp. SORGH_AS_0862]|uniref:hypothetical protein n=1 Tax=Microbacterium sp. SORGH_AS_0862 TaxID=3041789 RepID=UPI00278DA615|nr:hypothetical protein [Microbacterium sp. SORGH_AS_0862]MDQ1205176.1 hypothetical protein [Microbacterium sp. SORGH_AS_0862]